MASTTSFTLTAEMTRLIPFETIGKTATAFHDVARQLSSTGSNIVVEEDLAGLFGCSRIEKRVESSFS